MRPFKPITTAFGSVIAAVFGALFVFFGAQVAPAPASATAAGSQQQDLQAKRLTSSSEKLVGRDARLADKTPQPKHPHFPADPAHADSHRLALASVRTAPRVLGRAAERWPDRRQTLLVGTVELRV